MAVYTKLDEPFLRTLLSLYPAGELVSSEGIPQGSINTTFRLRTTKGTYFLRVNEGKGWDDVCYEKDLLRHLERAAPRLGDVVTPRIVKNNVHGHFFPVEGRKPAALFEELPGRD